MRRQERQRCRQTRNNLVAGDEDIFGEGVRLKLGRMEQVHTSTGIDPTFMTTIARPHSSARQHSALKI